MARTCFRRLWRIPLLTSEDGEDSSDPPPNPRACNARRCNARCRTPVPEIVGVDISGRHAEDGEYLMVAAAVHARIGANAIRSVDGMGFAYSHEAPTLDATVALVADAVAELPDPHVGPVVAERGEFYGEPADRVGVSLRPDFKYVESIAERQTVQAAHHAAYAARELMR